MADVHLDIFVKLVEERIHERSSLDRSSTGLLHIRFSYAHSSIPSYPGLRTKISMDLELVGTAGFESGLRPLSTLLFVNFFV